ncbi:MAG: hypothetical protein KJ706_04040 [Candidatus Omnitrophica bacterium]|nr:hypothetical protein [Candidatus Omnitrophota bacterium]
MKEIDVINGDLSDDKREKHIVIIVKGDPSDDKYRRFAGFVNSIPKTVLVLSRGKDYMGVLSTEFIERIASNRFDFSPSVPEFTRSFTSFFMEGRGSGLDIRQKI